MQEKVSAIDSKLHWYKDAVIYEVHIKAFRDSNGDGIGDFKGLIEKLDYLQDLGVTAIWVLPFYPSPQRDDGYDIADYYSVNPAYGDIRQFQDFLREAHKRHLKVITELVINHTSDQHPWFQRARRAPKGSPERDYYVWSDDPNKYKDVRIIFQDFESSNWSWDSVAQQYYWHRFFHHQPDLNYDNPLVQDEVFKIIDYWCAMGVDGFRLDAVPYLFEREGTNGENLPETHEYLKKLRRYLDEKYPGTLMLAEANMWPEDSASYFGNGDECHMNYHFPVMPRMFMALQTEDRYPITDIFDQTPDIPETCQWAMFLRNHDELTLEMVTDEERDYMYKVYVKDPRARINLGIRHRLAPLMGNNRKKIELLNYLLFSMPGTPVLYYGDEIGMGDNFYLGDRNGVRTPMQWSSDRNAGFSEANPQRLYLPVILDPEYHYESVNVEMQNRNTSSLLWWTKRMINKRKQYKSLSRGDMKFLQIENPKILAFTRTYEDETMLVIVNLSRYTQPAEIDLQEFRGRVPVEVFSKNKFPSVKDELPYFFTLGPHDCQWFLLENVVQNVQGNKALPTLEISEWNGTMTKQMREELEYRILPDYLMRMRWFGGKSRGIEHIHVTDSTALHMDNTYAMFVLINVSYNSGLPDTYQLPLAFGKDHFAYKINEFCPQAVLAKMKVGHEEGVLYDAIYGLSLQQAIIHNLAGRSSSNGIPSSLHFTAGPQVAAYVRDHDKIKPRVLSAEQSNTSIIYDNAFFLKLYRKVDRSINPDLEISHFLTERAKFEHIPTFVGSLEWVTDHGNIVLGMVQQMVDSNSDAWAYMLDRLDDYNERILSSNVLDLPHDLRGSIIEPADYDELPEQIKLMLDGQLVERVKLLGRRSGEMHIKLASDLHHPDFRPEPYSLHYQRSLYAGLQSLVRATFSTLSKKLKDLPENVQKEAEELLAMKHEILVTLKNIYRKKIDVDKIRIHGDYHLGQVLFTGKDFVITDFEGEPARSYSERRLKRSALRDVAGMIRSFHYAAYGSLFLDNQIRTEDISKLMPFADQWFHYMSGFFMRAYMKTVEGHSFIPHSKEDLEILMNTFTLEKAIYELNYELNNRPDWVIIPIRGIKAVLRKEELELAVV
jgi:maltose alpha-D-glucosyltransferase / alpha-amylase